MNKFVFSSGKIKTLQEQFFSQEHYPFKLVLFSGLFLLILKFFFTDKYFPIIANSLLEFMILLSIYTLLFVSKKFVSPEKATFHKIAGIIFYALIFFHLFVFSLNSVFLNESLLMKYSLSNFDFNAFQFLLEDIIPLKYIILTPLVITALCLTAKINLKGLNLPERHFKKIFWVLLAATLLLLLFSFDSISNVYANTIHEKVFSEYVTKVHFDDKQIAQAMYSPDRFDNQLGNYSDYRIPKGQKVLMFVMEQTSYRAFMEDSGKIPENRSFFIRVKNNTHLFTNYYTNNQDSMTSVWTMLNSEFIPFESYISNWNKFYGFTLGANNLVDLFNYNLYETRAVSATYSSGLILGVYNWTNVTFLNPQRQYGEFFCPQEFEYEPGCEDNIILGDVEGIIKNSKEEGLFLVQEFIYGHGVEYENTMHKTKTEYYNDYFLNLYNFLEQQSLLKNTTIFILADHGEKGYFDKELWNYQTPLLVISKNLEYKEIDDIYSNIDFKDILLSYLQGTELKPGNNLVPIIGQTQSSEIASVDGNGDYFLAKLDKSNTLRLKEMKGFGRENLESTIKTLLKYKLDAIQKSNEKDYWCRNCDQNRIKAGL